MAFGAVGALAASGYGSALASASGAAGSSLWSSGSLWGGLASAAGSVLGGLMGYSASAEAAHVQRETMRQYMKLQARENQVNRDWTEQMSNTAHQREVADLRAAGLNPILSATGGNGASSPTVSSNILGANDSSAATELNGKLQMINMLSELGSRLSQIDLNSSLAEKARSDSTLSDSAAVKNLSDINVNSAKEAALKSNTALDLSRMGEINSRSDLNRVRSKYEAFREFEIKANAARHHSAADLNRANSARIDLLAPKEYAEMDSKMKFRSLQAEQIYYQVQRMLSDMQLDLKKGILFDSQSWQAETQGVKNIMKSFR